MKLVERCGFRKVGVHRVTAGWTASGATCFWSSGCSTNRFFDLSDRAPDVHELFHQAMASLASGVAVVTGRRADGHPCGLAATSITSFSARPPSLLVSVSHESRCHRALAESDRFGVHLMRADELELARVFAGKGDDKFAGVDWHWDDDVPELAGTLAYLHCRREANFEHYDHTVLIGDIERGRIEEGEPLLYARRRMDWLLRLGD
jgi:flavin reductase (DIM6/NTAB) family NADH-FMN oxidoreductase RutF